MLELAKWLKSNKWNKNNRNSNKQVKTALNQLSTHKMSWFKASFSTINEVWTMQELQVNIEQAKVEIVGQEVFEKGIADVVAKYQNYTVTAGTIKDDKKVLAELRKLIKQISDERIKIKNELSKPATDFEK